MPTLQQDVNTVAVDAQAAAPLVGAILDASGNPVAGSIATLMPVAITFLQGAQAFAAAGGMDLAQLQALQTQVCAKLLSTHDKWMAMNAAQAHPVA